jgi:hypothetical protein
MMLEQLQQRHADAIEAVRLEEERQRQRAEAIELQRAGLRELDEQIADASSQLVEVDPFSKDFSGRAQARERDKIVRAASLEQLGAMEAQHAKGEKRIEDLRRAVLDAAFAILAERARIEVTQLQDLVCKVVLQIDAGLATRAQHLALMSHASQRSAAPAEGA